MALKVRLARGGAKKRPFYSIVIADARAPRDGRFIEKVGTYNPMVPREHETRLTLNTERIKYWLSVGAQPTDRVARFLAADGLIPQRAIPQQTKKNLPGAKAVERQREKAEALAKAAAAKAEAATETETEAA